MNAKLRTAMTLLAVLFFIGSAYIAIAPIRQIVVVYKFSHGLAEPAWQYDDLTQAHLDVTLQIMEWGFVFSLAFIATILLRLRHRVGETDKSH